MNQAYRISAQAHCENLHLSTPVQAWLRRENSCAISDFGITWIWLKMSGSRFFIILIGIIIRKDRYGNSLCRCDFQADISDSYIHDSHIRNGDCSASWDEGTVSLKLKETAGEIKLFKQQGCSIVRLTFWKITPINRNLETEINIYYSEIGFLWHSFCFFRITPWNKFQGWKLKPA